MSDMYTWLNIMENGARVPFKEGEAVQLSKRCGGGVGQFAGFSPERGTCTINIKGAPQEFQLDDIEAAIDPSASYYKGNSEEQRYGEVDGGQHYLPDKPELQPGQMVRINNIYGQGNGEGYGVFVAYALDGQSAICNVDSENKTIPIEFVEAAPEESDDCFSDTGNDGALSPMSFGDEMRINVEDGKEDVTMEDLEKWMQVIEDDGVDVEDDAEELEEAKDKDCDCGSYDCSVCFPDDKDVSEEIIDENEIFDIVYELAEEDEFEDDLDEAYNDDDEEIEEMRMDEFSSDKRAQRRASGTYGKKTQGVREEGPEDEFDTGDSSAEFASDGDAMVDVGDAPDMGGSDPMAGMDKEMGEPTISGSSEDVSDLIAKIAYVQDMGMSMTDRFYDPDKLSMMKPEMIQRIHAKVVGVDESAGGMGAGGIASGVAPVQEGGMGIHDSEYDTDNLLYILKHDYDLELDTDTFDEVQEYLYQDNANLNSAREIDDALKMAGHPGVGFNIDGVAIEGTEQDSVGRPRADAETRAAADAELGDFDPSRDFPMESVDEDEEAVEEGCDDVKEEDAEDLEEGWYAKYMSTLEEKKADKDYDGDGEIEDEEDEYKGSKDNAIKKAKVDESADPDIVKAMKALFE